MHCPASHQATGDLGGLMARPWRRRMGGEVARRSDEDRRCLSVTLPGEVLPHGDFQILHHVEASVLAQERVAQQCNEIDWWIARGNVVRGQPRSFCDLLLAVTGIEECAANGTSGCECSLRRCRPSELVLA